jgi:DNA-binding protein H-NS
MDLSKMSQKELTKLKQDVEKALVQAEERDRREALEAASRAAAEYGYSLEELASAGTPAKRRKASAKYRNPNNPTQTWSGLGRKPQWIHDALAKGLDITDLEI